MHKQIKKPYEESKCMLTQNKKGDNHDILMHTQTGMQEDEGNKATGRMSMTEHRR